MVPTSNLGKLLSAAKSGFRRYPRAIIDSVRRPFVGRSPVILGPPSGPPILDPHSLAAMWLGHATVFVRLCGLNILVDPVFSDRIGVNVGGMTIGTIFTLFIVPSLYVLIAREHNAEKPAGVDVDGDNIPDGRSMPEFALADGNDHWKA